MLALIFKSETRLAFRYTVLDKIQRTNHSATHVQEIAVIFWDKSNALTIRLLM